MIKPILRKSAALNVILFLFCVFYFFYPQQVFAHPPESVRLEYDAASQTLKVTVTHKSSAPDTHFVKMIIIKKNGYILSTNEYDSQPAPDTFSYVYDVSTVEDGDTFEVTAFCSVYGDKTGTLSVKE